MNVKPRLNKGKFRFTLDCGTVCLFEVLKEDSFLLSLLTDKCVFICSSLSSELPRFFDSGFSFNGLVFSAEEATRNAFQGFLDAMLKDEELIAA